VIGTALNVAGIVVGGICGLTVARRLAPRTQYRIRGGLAALVAYAGFGMVWDGLRSPLTHTLKQLGIALLALSLGSFTGWVLHLQAGMNRAGESVRRRFQNATLAGPGAVSPTAGFITCTLLFCVGPMAILGSVQDGLDGQWRTLALKGLMDGLATMGFVATFGWSPILAAIPVLVYQGTLTLAASFLAPVLRDAALKDNLNVTGGLIVATIALVILDIRKVPLANYLPALVYGPLLTRWWG
jgi:hypothetical protein